MSEYVEECKRKPIGLYDPRFEHDNCGIGAIVNIKGKKTHSTVKNALEIVANLEHRAGKIEEAELHEDEEDARGGGRDHEGEDTPKLPAKNCGTVKGKVR